jgi:hypothetical protein
MVLYLLANEVYTFCTLTLDVCKVDADDLIWYRCAGLGGRLRTPLRMQN